MSKIPEDIREKALKLSSGTFGSSDDKDVMEVAAVLMAEREACAKVCETMTWFKEASPKHVIANTPADYAAAIRASR